MPSLRGRLLVATPTLLDPNFFRTVVLVLEHGETGAIGLVLNRPSTTDVEEILAQWVTAASEPRVVFVGGPVQPQGAIALGRASAPDDSDGFAHLFGGIGTIDLEQPATVMLEQFRLYAGYAGWSAGQLERELEEGAWFVLDAADDDAWCGEPDSLWHDVLARQPSRVRLFANCPLDPSTN